jgi:hypothetical protein
MRFASVLAVSLTVSVAMLAVALAGCGTSDPVAVVPAANHQNIILRGVTGNPLTKLSTEPYSPRQTCGACHDIDRIANGFHFQQGRTNSAGTVQTMVDFFGDDRSWILSDGMYGKH